VKRRPRRIESEVARHLSLFSSQYGLSPVQRIPVLGRSGPDLTINELGLVIDVKSRLSAPKGWSVLQAGRVGEWGDLVAVRLGEIELLEEMGQVMPLYSSTLVTRWFSHMDQWTQAHHPDGITALVLHRPGLHVGNSTLVIKKEDRRKLYDRYHHHSIPTGLISCTV
jgi:hypothetical protein